MAICGKLGVIKILGSNFGVRSFVITSKEGREAGLPPLLLSRWREATTRIFKRSRD